MFKKSWSFMIFLIVGCGLAILSWHGLDGRYVGKSESYFNTMYNLSVAGMAIAVICIIISLIGWFGEWGGKKKDAE